MGWELGWSLRKLWEWPVLNFSTGGCRIASWERFGPCLKRKSLRFDLGGRPGDWPVGDLGGGGGVVTSGEVGERSGVVPGEIVNGVGHVLVVGHILHLGKRPGGSSSTGVLDVLNGIAGELIHPWVSVFLGDCIRGVLLAHLVSPQTILLIVLYFGFGLGKEGRSLLTEVEYVGSVVGKSSVALWDQGVDLLGLHVGVKLD